MNTDTPLSGECKSVPYRRIVNGQEFRAEAVVRPDGTIRFQQTDALLHNSDRGRVFVWSRFASSDHLTARHPQLRHRV